MSSDKYEDDDQRAFLALQKLEKQRDSEAEAALTKAAISSINDNLLEFKKNLDGKIDRVQVKNPECGQFIERRKEAHPNTGVVTANSKAGLIKRLREMLEELEKEV